MDDNPVVGHKTFLNDDGSYRHEPLRKDEADAFLAKTDREEAQRAADMPDDATALYAMFRAWLRLKELGWREAMYCPKDGTHFDAISAGSTGIHETWYQGEWPDGHWWCFDHGDIWPSSPILFRLRANQDEDDR